MKPFFFFCCLTCFATTPALSQEINVEGIVTFVSPVKDSIYIQGLENDLIINFDAAVGDSMTYMLVGYDKGMVHNRYPSLRYTNLPGGNYQLKYKIGQASEYSEIKVTVLEAIWQKWWFWPMIVFYILLVIGVGTYLFFLYNFRQKLKVQNIRNRISADLHDEVGSNLSSIAIFSEVLKKQIDKNDTQANEVIKKIIENSKESVRLMQDTVWTLNPQNDTSEKLIFRVINFGTEILAQKYIAFSHEVEIDSKLLKLDMEERKNCYLILKEALNNIAKHSDAHNAQLAIFQKNGHTYFELKDDGKGFDIKIENEGNGLRNFKERAEESDFEIEIKSKVGAGTTITVII